MKRAAAEARGRKAERRAAWWLRLHGWRILGERLRVAAGEVDLVARRGRIVAFIEVKWRERGPKISTSRSITIACAASRRRPKCSPPASPARAMT